MTTNSNNSNDSQQVSQQLQSERSTLPLLYLPYRLAEETSLYFEPKEAARALSVSRSFYKLFITRVWYDLQDCYQYGDRNNFEQWFKKYGQYVRLVKPLEIAACRLEATVDWLKYVNRATRLTASISVNSPDDVSRLIKCLQQIKSLRTVNLTFDSCRESLPGMVEIAKAINELDLVSCIKIHCLNYITMLIRYQWAKIIEFVGLLHPSKRSKLELELNFDNSITAEHVRALAPYLAKLHATANRLMVFAICGNRNSCDGNEAVSTVITSAGTGQVFPRLVSIIIKSCSSHPQFYDFKDVTPTCAPRLRRLSYCRQGCASCRHEQGNAVGDRLIWKPEFSKCAHVVVPSHHWPNLVNLYIGTISSERLMNIVSLNPQLQYVTINPSPSIYESGTRRRRIFTAKKFNHDVFKIDKILEKLPRLRTLTIAKLYAVVDAEPGSIPLERRRGITVEIGSRMAVTPAAINYLLQMQQLTELQFHEFAFTDINETIKLLRDSAGSCGTHSFTWYPVEWHQELALAMTAKMPKLVQLSAQGCPEKYRAIFEDKCKCYF